MKNKIAKIMEKTKKLDAQNVQNKGKGDGVTTSKRQLPKLHIKIPFFKNSVSKSSSEDCKVDPRLSQSLPSESHMPSNIHDPDLYRDHVCDECRSPVSSCLDKCCKGCNPTDDEADSEKHQSDLEENEKDSENETTQGELGKGSKSKRSDTDESATESQECCLKSCLKKDGTGRRRANTFPGMDGCEERHVTFSPDTVEPRARTCRYREWIELHSQHPKCPPMNLKHEKRKCQLNQMRKVNISDYMSRNYGSSFYNPIASFGGDMLM